jgi:thymidylate kinase
VETAYRHLVSVRYQRRGYLVVYDRHVLFDSATAGKHRQLSDRIFNWIVRNVFPKPSCVLFLDAPPEVLLARKAEGTLEYLERKRQAYIAQGASMPCFVRIDATRPLQEVLESVRGHVFAVARGGTTSAE